MGYTRLSIRNNDKVRKYILFYADYLNEAWLSEVVADDTTKIIKQFRCKSLRDVSKLVQYISTRGEVLNLASSETHEEYLRVLESELVKTPSKKISFMAALNLALVPYRLLWSRLTRSASRIEMAG